MESATPNQASELVALTVAQVLDDGNTDTRIVVLKSHDEPSRFQFGLVRPRAMPSVWPWNGSSLPAP